MIPAAELEVDRPLYPAALHAKHCEGRHPILSDMKLGATVFPFNIGRLPLLEVAPVPE